MIINRRPTSEGSFTAWLLGLGASKAAAVDPGDPPTDDDDTTFIRGQHLDAESFFMAPPVLSLAAVTSFTATARVRNVNVAAVTLNTWAYDGSTQGAAVGQAVPGDSTWYTYAAQAIGRPGGGAWTPADMASAAMEIGVDRNGVGASQFRVTTLYGILTATPAGGGFAFLVASVLGALHAVGAHEIARLSNAVRVATRGEYVIEPHEYLQVHAELHMPRRLIYTL